MITTLVLWVLVANTRYLYNCFILALAYVVYSSVMTLSTIDSTHLMFNSYNSYDPLTVTVVLVASIVLIWVMTSYVELQSIVRGLSLNNEMLTLLMLLVVAITGLASSNSYLSLFVAIELQSLVLYILLATRLTEDSITSVVSKVSLSYLINAATATALLLFGIATNSGVLTLAAVLWKLGVMPVHVWSLPVLDNQHSLIVAAYLTLAKYGVLVVIAILASSSAAASTMLLYVALLNLVAGNVLGLLQYRYQRIIVYSSMIQIGYMLLVISSATSLALTFFELYSFYTVMLLTLWTLPTYSSYNASRMMPRAQLWVMILVLYTVAGLPFMPLFWTKLDVLLAVSSQATSIALISTLLSSLIYIRLIKYFAFFRTAVTA